MEDVNLANREVIRRLGNERFLTASGPLDFNLLDFWGWCSSDLANNAMRGVLAEYLVARALGTAEGVRVEWDAYDVTTKRGVKVEVKSSAYLQSWQQAKVSVVEFDVAPKTPDATRPELGTERKRQADVYVFALLKHRNKATLNPLNIDQWEFYVLPTATLDKQIGGQKKIRLAPLLNLNPEKATFDTLPAAIERAFPDANASETTPTSRT